MPPSVDIAKPVLITMDRVKIYAYVDAKGVCPFEEFLSTLDRSAKKRYVISFQKMCMNGFLRGEEWHVWDPAYKRSPPPIPARMGAFKDIESKSRVPSFWTDERGIMVLTHGFGGKKEDDIDVVEVNRAIRIRNDYCARIGKAESTNVNVRKGKKK